MSTYRMTRTKVPQRKSFEEVFGHKPPRVWFDPRFGAPFSMVREQSGYSVVGTGGLAR